MTIPATFHGRYRFTVGDWRYTYDLDTTGGFLVINPDPLVVWIEYPDGSRVRQEPVLSEPAGALPVNQPPADETQDA